MRRGDIFLVDFDPARGAEVDKRRPAVVVSNEGTNRRIAELSWGVVNVVPLTTRIEPVRRFQVLIPASESGLEFDSKAQTEQIRAVAMQRVQQPLGFIPPPLMRQIDQALRIQLAL